MCLIFLSINHHPIYKLIVASNRDEFYSRKTAQARFWNDYPDIVGGRDLEASGTWMAMNKNGKISLVTNYRDPANINPKAPSRGQLVSDFLVNGDTPAQYMQKVAEVGHHFNGFNLLAGTANELWYYSNYAQRIQKLQPGNYGLSNHLLDTPWPKVSHGKERFSELIKSEDLEPNLLFDMLYNEVRAADHLLPDTGIGLERERALSSMFIKTEGYGTRCSTVVLVNKDNQVSYAERVYDLTTFEHKTHVFEFTIH